jgi:DNA-binding beta-propeller fold protein YncE
MSFQVRFYLYKLSVISALALFAANFSPMSVAQATPGRSTATLRQIAVIDLPGPVGKRFDYLTIDRPDDYLLSAHLGAGILYVIDLKTNKLVRAIPGVPGIEGVVYVPQLHKAYTSDWLENKIGVVDLRTMKVLPSCLLKPNRMAAPTRPHSIRSMSPTNVVRPKRSSTYGQIGS